jgi:Holliday junction resolvasome RuvABC endonuclease subunit
MTKSRMTNNPKYFPRALVLCPTTRGISFALFTAPRSLGDWGTKRMTGTSKNADSLHAAKKLMDFHQPNILVMEDVRGHGSRRGPRIRQLSSAIAAHAKRSGIEIVVYPRTAIKAVFAPGGGSTKHEINCAIALLIPALRASQPRKRRAWDAEPAAQGLFDAAALGVTYFADIGQLDIAQAIQGDDEAPLSVRCERTPYLLSSLVSPRSGMHSRHFC